MTVLTFLVTGIRAEMKRQGDKLAEIDRDYINRNELRHEMAEVREHIERRHEENRGFLEKISNKIDVNEDKESKTRHDIRDAVNALVIQQSVFQEKIELWRKENERTAAAAAHAATAAADAAARAAALANRTTK